MIHLARYQFRGLNTDDDNSIIPFGDYRSLKNGRIGKGNVIENIKGMVKVNDAGQFPTGTNKCIGGRYIDEDGYAYFFLYNGNSNHGIYRFKDGTITKILEWSGLGFSEDMFIDQIAVIRGQIYWVHGDHNPRVVDIQKAIDDEYPSPLKEEYITLVKRPPAFALQVTRRKDNNFAGNFIKDNAFQFAYRYLYDDFKYSVLSPYSELINKQLIIDDTLDFNYLELSIPSGEDVPDNLRKIQIFVKYDDQQLFYKIKELNPGESTFDFYNDINGVPEDNIITSQLYDDVPLKAKCLAFMDNRLMMVNVIKGFNLPDSITMALTVEEYPKLIQTTDEVYRIFEDDGAGNETDLYYCIEVKDFYGEIGSTSYHIAEYDSLNDVATQQSSEAFAHQLADITKLTPPALPTLPAFRNFQQITPAEVYRISDLTDKPTFKKGGAYRVGILFKDFSGRHSGHILPSVSEIQISQDPEDEKNYVINWNLNSATIDQIPDWATHYQLVITENLKTTYFVKGITNDAWYESIGAGESGDYNKGTSATPFPRTRQFLYLDASDIVLNNFGYTFEEGDYIKVWIPTPDFQGNTPLVENIFPIESFDSRFIKVNYGKAGRGLGDRTAWYYEIYRPRKSDIDIRFYETSNVYAINNPGTSTRDFSIKSGIILGDVFTVKYKHYNYITSGYSSTDPDSNTFYDTNDDPKLDFLFEEFMSPRPDQLNLWLKSLGKVSLINEGEGEVEDTTSIIYGQQIIANSKINDLNRFFTLDRYDKIQNDKSPIIKLTPISESLMIANHERSTTSLYIGTGFIQTKDGSEFLAKTEGVITDHQTLVGEYGAIPETIASEGYRVWWLDIEKGKVVRYTAAGTIPISDKKFKIDNLIQSLCEIYKPYVATNKIIGGYDPEFNEYILTFPKITGVSEARTLIFSEDTQRWQGDNFDYVGPDGLTPQFYIRSPKKFLSFMNGELWEHHVNPVYNNFYGQQFNRELTFTPNAAPEAKKVWNNIWINTPYLVQNDDDNVVTITNEEGQETDLLKSEFDDIIKTEGIWKGPVYFDKNSSGGKKNGARIRSNYIDVKIVTNSTSRNPLRDVALLFKFSEMTR